ncbi:MAG: hypothetical protein JXR45_07085, partial [Deltaproteobacteria bacterium]|nr:hypothetical protein [Deltaproteobacteria bacterium]
MGQKMEAGCCLTVKLLGCPQDCPHHYHEKILGWLVLFLFRRKRFVKGSDQFWFERKHVALFTLPRFVLKGVFSQRKHQQPQWIIAVHVTDVAINTVFEAVGHIVMRISQDGNARNIFPAQNIRTVIQ